LQKWTLVSSVAALGCVSLAAASNSSTSFNLSTVNSLETAAYAADFEPALIRAAQKGDLAKVKRLIEEQGAKVDARDDDGETALHAAAEKARLDVVKYLVKKGADVKAKDEDGETVMTILDGRCPMWRQDGLCRIQAELGESALCKTCREFPRLTHDYGDFLELGLELSCPEAAKFILTQDRPLSVSEEVSGGEEAEYDEEAMAVLKATRETALDILFDPGYSVAEALAMTLLYGYQAQGELDGEEPLSFDPEAALNGVREFVKPGNPREMVDFFLNLELLTPEWNTLLQNPSPAPWTDHHRALAGYLIQRYWLQAVSDYDLYCRVKFIVITCLLVKHLGGDIFRTAQLYSKEIENNIDNVEAILDGAYAHPAFTDDKILGMLLN
jgi:lysine-N-methylase